MQPIYQTLLQRIVDEAMRQEDVLGILFIGSVARGKALFNTHPPPEHFDVRGKPQPT